MRPTVDYGNRSKMDKFTGVLDQDAEATRQPYHNRKRPGRKHRRRGRRGRR